MATAPLPWQPIFWTDPLQSRAHQKSLTIRKDRQAFLRFHSFLSRLLRSAAAPGKRACAASAEKLAPAARDRPPPHSPPRHFPGDRRPFASVRRLRRLPAGERSFAGSLSPAKTGSSPIRPPLSTASRPLEPEARARTWDAGLPERRLLSPFIQTQRSPRSAPAPRGQCRWPA